MSFKKHTDFMIDFISEFANGEMDRLFAYSGTSGRRFRFYPDTLSVS